MNLRCPLRRPQRVYMRLLSARQAFDVIAMLYTHYFAMHIEC